MKSENIHYTKKWKKKRKNHFGDMCNKANCPICARHKNIGNSQKMDKKKQKIVKNALKFEKDLL